MPPDGGLHQRGGRLSDPQHMVMPQHSSLLVGGEVAGHPELGAAAALYVVLDTSQP